MKVIKQSELFKRPMMIHAHISHPECCACRVLPKNSEYLIGVLGDHMYNGYTRPFEFNGADIIPVTYCGVISAEVCADADFYTEIALCRRRVCMHCGESSSAYILHSVCYQILRSVLSSHGIKLRFSHIWGFASAVAPLFPVSNDNRLLWKRTAFEQCLITWSPRQIGLKLNEDDQELFFLLQRLPVELRQLIAQLCYPCAWESTIVVTAEIRTLLRAMQPSKKVHLDLRTDLYGCRVSYAGRSYIVRMEKTQSKGDALLWYGSTRGTAIVQMDDMGVLDIQPSIEMLNQRSRVPFWYKRLPISDSGVTARFEGLFFKDIISTERFLWDTPDPPALDLGDISASVNTKDDKPALIRYISVSGKLQGISASSSIEGTISLHGHYYGTDNLGFYKEVEERYKSKLVWMYFPLGKDERVTEALIRELMDGCRRTFLMRTSVGRSGEFGPYVPPDKLYLYQSRPLSKRNSDITGICYNDPDPKKALIASIVAVPSAEGSSRLLSRPLRHLPRDIDGVSSWFYSEISLLGMIGYQVCIDDSSSQTPCLGLMVHFRQRSEILGQWRHDRRVRSTNGFGNYLHYVSAPINGRPCILDLVFDEHAAAPDPRNWTTVSLEHPTCLGWWFSHNAAKIDIYRR